MTPPELTLRNATLEDVAAIEALMLEVEHGEADADPMMARIAKLKALRAGKSVSTPKPRRKAANKYRIVGWHQSPCSRASGPCWRVISSGGCCPKAQLRQA